MASTQENEEKPTFEQKMLKFAETPKKVAIPMILNVSICVVLLILTVQQSYAINEVGNQEILGVYFSRWFNDVCQNFMIQYISPFVFDFHIHIYNEDLGLLGCPWRVRQTIYRSIIICTIIIIELWMLVILFSRLQEKQSQKIIWQFFTLLHFILFLAMVITFVLDCDGTYSGFIACRWNFDYANLGGPIFLALMNAEWTTTHAPIWPAFFGPPRMDNIDVDTNAWNYFQVVDYCFIQPFIWTCIFDLFCVILTYISYQINSYYAHHQCCYHICILITVSMVLERAKRARNSNERSE